MSFASWRLLGGDAAWWGLPAERGEWIGESGAADDSEDGECEGYSGGSPVEDSGI